MLHQGQGALYVTALFVWGGVTRGRQQHHSCRIVDPFPCLGNTAVKGCNGLALYQICEPRWAALHKYESNA